MLRVIAVGPPEDDPIDNADPRLAIATLVERQTRFVMLGSFERTAARGPRAGPEHVEISSPLHRRT